jgi:PAS domain S-box-containing protein
MKPAPGGNGPELGPEGAGTRLAFDAMVELAVFHEMVYGPEGQAIDYRILDCNAAFTRTTGIQREAAVGLLASAVYNTAPPYLEAYGRVAATGEPTRFDAYFPPLDRHFSISVVSPRRGFFVTIASDITDRHCEAEVLRRYQLLAEHGQDIVLFVRREDGRVLEANVAAVRAYGYTRDELLALTIFDVRERATVGATASQMASADERGVLFETVHRRKDGSTFPVEVSSRGALVGGERLLVSVVRDISARRAAQEALLRSEAQLQTIVENIVEGVVVADVDGRLRYWNRAALEMHGFTGAEQPARELGQLADRFELFSEKGVLALEEWPLSRILRGEHLQDLRLSVRSKSDTWQRIFSYGGRLAHDPDGRGLLAVVTVKDITERERTENRLSAERERLAVTLRSIGDGVIATDGKAHVTLFNDVAETLTGWKAAEAIGRPVEQVFTIVNEQTRNPAPNPIHRVLHEGVIVGLANHTALLARDGTERPIADSGAPIRDGSGRLCGAVLVFRDQTEERQSDQALRNSEERYRGLFENIAEEMTIYGLIRGDSGEIIDWVVREQNKQARSSGGGRAESLVGMRLTDILGKDAAWPFIEKSREVMRTGASSAADLRLELNGRHYHASLFRLDDDTLVTAALDVTQWKQAEEALAASENLHRSLFTLAPSGVLLIGRDGRILRFNDRAAAQLGYTREEFANLSVSDIDAEETPGDVEARIARILAGGEQEFEARQRTKEGGVRSVVVSVRPVLIGREECILSVMQDQTERKRAADALRESEERLRIAFQTSPDAINLNRMSDGVYVSINEGFTRIMGWTEADVVGRSSLDLGIWEDPADRARLMEQLRAQGYAQNLEAEFRAKDGRLVPGLMSARLISLHGEQYILSITRDISAWKAAERERDALQARLHQAAKMEAIGQLAGGVAHDFNNLLTVILSCSETLEADLHEGRPVSAEDVGEIHAAGLRAGDLTRQLLTFARRQVITPQPVDLGSVVRGCERLLRRVLGEDVNLAVSSQSDLWLVRADPGQMEQIILNLAVNARDAMPAGGTLRVETTNFLVEEHHVALHPEISAGEHVRLFVQDTGTGMTAEVKERIFEPFFTTKGPGKGSGLGLETVFGIVKQSGGFIRVESETGRGTAFEICLPRTLDVPVATRPRSKASASRGTERILLVEDDPGVREVTSRALRSGGYEVIVATASVDAPGIAAREEGPLHLLITDVVMPGLGGRDLAQQLRKVRPGLKVLFISGYAENILSRDGVLEAGTELLLKPFTAAALLARVRAVLSGPQ